jgi:hypothetical protein
MLLRAVLLVAFGQHRRGSHPTHQPLAGLPDPDRPGVLGVVDYLQLGIQLGKLLLRPLLPPAAVGQLARQLHRPPTMPPSPD